MVQLLKFICSISIVIESGSTRTLLYNLPPKLNIRYLIYFVFNSFSVWFGVFVVVVLNELLVMSTLVIISAQLNSSCLFSCVVYFNVILIIVLIINLFHKICDIFCFKLFSCVFGICLFKFSSNVSLICSVSRLWRAMYVQNITDWIIAVTELTLLIFSDTVFVYYNRRSQQRECRFNSDAYTCR